LSKGYACHPGKYFQGENATPPGLSEVLVLFEDGDRGLIDNGSLIPDTRGLYNPGHKHDHSRGPELLVWGTSSTRVEQGYFAKNNMDWSCADTDETTGASGGCSCFLRCGEGCANRSMHVECYGAAAGTGNCALGPECGNRRVMTKGRRVVGTFVAKTHSRGGEGLFLLEPGVSGGFVGVLEGRAVGSVPELGSEDCGYCVKAKRGQLFVIDPNSSYVAKINHSCNPNCQLEEVDLPHGEVALVVVLLRDSAVLEEVTFDYGTSGRPRPCNCAVCLSNYQDQDVCTFGSGRPRLSCNCMQSEGNQNTDQQEQGTGPWNLRKIHPGLWVGDLKMATRAVSEGDGAFSGILNLCGKEPKAYKEGLGQGLPFVLHRSTRLGNVDERYFALKAVDFLEDSLQSLFSDPLKAAMVFLIEVCGGGGGGGPAWGCLRGSGG
jgi:hypothetical protein